MSVVLFVLSFFVTDAFSKFISHDCHVVRAVFDVGSGSTKMQVAEVNRCEGKKIATLLNEKRAVKYEEDREKSKNSAYSNQIMNEGVNSLLELKKLAMNHGATEFLAVGTAALRKAQNAEFFIDLVQKKVGITLLKISQSIEAEIGFYSGLTQFADRSKENLVVWDIGGGSSQISYYDDNGDFGIFKTDLAAVTFKNKWMIHKNLSGDNPNPMSKADIDELFDFSKDLLFSIPVPKELRTKIEAGVKVVGIGGLHHWGIKDLVSSETDFYTKDQIWNSRFIYANQKEIDRSYPETVNTNLALIYSYLDRLEIQQVYTADVNLTDGLLIYPEVPLRRIFHSWLKSYFWFLR